MKLTLEDESLIKEKPIREPERNKRACQSMAFKAFVLMCCFFSHALSLGFFVSFGTIYVELINIFKTTETTAGTE